jgi:hypothetical protein
MERKTFLFDGINFYPVQSVNFLFPQTSKCFLSKGIKNVHMLASGLELQTVLDLGMLF